MSAKMPTLPQVTVYGLAALIVLGIVVRFVAKGADAVDDTTLNYAIAAAVLVLLREVKSLAWGDWKVEFDRRLGDLSARMDDTQAGMLTGRTHEGGPAHAGARSLAPSAPDSRGPLPGPVKNDPWATVFGGSPTNKNRTLEAEITDVGGDLFRVRLRVRSVAHKSFPLTGTVQFFLHDTFANDRPVVTVGPTGFAELVLTAWGAFTVGAVADGGATKLELDLAQLDGAPKQFRER